MTELENRLTAVLAESVSGFRQLRSVDRLSGGASQETYRIVVDTAHGERRFALRRAAGGAERPASAGRPGLRTEALLMRCAREAGIPEPEILRVLEPGDGLGEGFVMEWLEGEALGARIVRSEQLEEIRPRLARQCGEILARIHALDVERTGLARHLERLSAEEFVDQTWERYRALATPQPMIDYIGCWLKQNLPPAVEPALVHNDFRNGNLMVSAERGVVAVLDWEIAHLGDPGRDLGWICTNSWRFGRSDLPVGGFGTYDDFFAGYEAVSGRPVDRQRVRFWEVFGSFWWAVGCLGMAEHYRTGPDRSVERAAIGRRSSECQVDAVNLLIPGPVELLEPEPLDSVLDAPRADELVESVRDFLRDEVMATTEGRPRFLARVAANSLDIVLRELGLTEALRAREHERLRRLLDRDGELEELRWRLIEALRSGAMSLEAPDLAAHLRTTVVNQVAVDQPRYSGLRTALQR